MAEVSHGTADLALDEWLSRTDHGSDSSRVALNEVFKLFAAERKWRHPRRLTTAMVVRRLAVYRVRRARAVGPEVRAIAWPFGDADGVQVGSPAADPQRNEGGA